MANTEGISTEICGELVKGPFDVGRYIYLSLHEGGQYGYPDPGHAVHYFLDNYELYGI
jgi:hypothetical protein